MKPKTPILLLSAALAAPVSTAAPIFSWETDTEGWTSGAPNSVATSTTSPTDGLQSLAVTQPFTGTNNWWNIGTTINLSAAQLQAIFTNATELKLDAFYPNPGYNSWFATPQIEIILQADNLGWSPIAVRDVPVDAPSQTLTFPLTVAQAAGMASSSSGQILLRFNYGHGGVTSPNAVFYIDNFTNTVVVDPAPATNLYWKGDVDDQWSSLNWTSDLAGTVPGGALPGDGTAGIAFAADGATNLSSVLGADQSVKSVVVTPGVNPAISGTHSLTIGADGIWLDEAAGGLTIDTTGGVVLGASQVWKNKSTSPLVVNSVISGSGTLTKSGAGPVRLGGANTHTGGTIVEQGVLALDHAEGLGGATAALTMNGGSLDLNGFSVTLGALSGLAGGAITNTALTPATLTLDVAADSAYNCQLNDAPGGAPVSLVKKGAATVTSSGGGSFSGPVSIEDGVFIANTWVFNVPNWSSFGNCQIGGRTITVTSPGALSFTTNAVFGNQNADTSLLPEIVVNETSLNSTRYNQIGDLTLNGAFLNQSSSDTGTYQGYQFKGDITVTGTAASSIQSPNGRSNHLSSDTLFIVANVTGDPAPDLLVSAGLTNQSGDFGNAPGGLSKSGPGTMTLDGFNTYTGTTKVLEGVLSVSSATLNDAAGVEIADGAVLDLVHFETDRVASLKIGEEIMADGIYGAQESGAPIERPEITGTGFIEVVSDPFVPWIATFTTLSGQAIEKDADPDGDGLTNIEEFGLDGDPEDGTATGKVRSRVEAVGADQALVITLPVRNGASFSVTAPAIATVAADGVDYEIGGSNDLVTFDQNVSEVVPALTGTPDMPLLNGGWTYRTFRLDGPVGGGTPRGPKGFLRAKVTATP
jgi:autotransporter-associated beta strand protein